jgi:predicted transposase YdaD
MWQQSSEIFLSDPALLPLAALTAKPSPEQLLRRIAAQVSTIELTEQRQDLLAYIQIMAGLRYPKDLVRQTFQEGIMRESVIYQEILQEGRQEGRREGMQEGERTLVLRLLNRRVGLLDSGTTAQVEQLSLEQLENLGDALLDFQTQADLPHWLEAQR